MPMFMGRRAFWLKVEGSYGTDAVPTAALDGVEVRDLEVDPLDVSYADRELVRAFYGQFQQLPTMKFKRVKYKLALAGFGTAGPAAPTAGYDATLRCLGLARTINTGVSVAYNPISTAFESGTGYYLQDGKQHKLLGVRGTGQLRFARNEIPYMSVDLMGLDGGDTDTAFSVPTLSAYSQPLACTPTNTTPFTIFGLSSAALQELTVDIGNDLVFRNLINSTEQILLKDRRSGGSVEIEDTLVATKDWLSQIRTATLGALDITHGTATGNKVQFTANQAQLTDPSLTGNDDIAHLRMGLRLLPTTAGNNEFTLTIK